MCFTPILIRNPNYKLGHIGLNAFSDTAHLYMQVPCGNCPQCVALRQSFYLQRVQMESFRSHLFMFTLTYNNDSLVYTDVGEYNIAVPHLPDVQNMFKRMRADGHKFRVSYVSEYGSRRYRPHFHGILALDKSLGDFRTLEKKYKSLFSLQWKRNYATTVNKNGLIVPNTRSPVWRPLFTPVYDKARCTTFDFHYIEPVIDHDNDCAFYVSKYITKYDDRTRKLLLKILQDPNLDDGQVSYLYKIVKPKCNTSKDFGSWKDPVINAYIQKCASRESLFRYPQYFDIYSGKQMAMSPYYGKHIVGFEHAYDRLLNSDFVDDMSTNFVDRSTLLDIEIERNAIYDKYAKFEKSIKFLSNRLSE